MNLAQRSALLDIGWRTLDQEQTRPDLYMTLRFSIFQEHGHPTEIRREGH